MYVCFSFFLHEKKHADIKHTRVICFRKVMFYWLKIIILIYREGRVYLPITEEKVKKEMPKSTITLKSSKSTTRSHFKYASLKLKEFDAKKSLLHGFVYQNYFIKNANWVFEMFDTTKVTFFLKYQI